SALTPTRPTRFRSPAPEIPCNTTQNTSTGMIILISLMKASLSGLSLTANSGTSRPAATPSNSAITTWPKSDLRKRGMGISVLGCMQDHADLACKKCRQDSPNFCEGIPGENEGRPAWETPSVVVAHSD